jgi:hypothetical protein
MIAALLAAYLVAGALVALRCRQRWGEPPHRRSYAYAVGLWPLFVLDEVLERLGW